MRLTSSYNQRYWFGTKKHSLLGWIFSLFL